MNVHATRYIRAPAILCTFLLVDHSIIRIATGHGGNFIEMYANVSTSIPLLVDNVELNLQERYMTIASLSKAQNNVIDYSKLNVEMCAMFSFNIQYCTYHINCEL